MTQERFELRESGVTLSLCLEDCVTGLRRAVKPGSVDVVVTSPPYNLGTGYRGYDDAQPREAYLAWTETWLAAVAESLSQDGSFFLNIAGKPSDPWVPYDVLMRARRHFRLQNVIHWVKSIAIEKRDVGNYPGFEQDLVAGHYKPIQSERFLNDCHEYVFHLTHTGEVALNRLAIGVPYRDKSNVRRWRSAAADRHCRGNTWFVPYPTIHRRDRQRPHPATFPPRLPEMCLRLHGLERIRLVVDPFLGIGSAALACAGLGLNFVGFEITRDYFDEARRRLREQAGLFATSLSAPLAGEAPGVGSRRRRRQ